MACMGWNFESVMFSLGIKFSMMALWHFRSAMLRGLISWVGAVLAMVTYMSASSGVVSMVRDV